MLLNNTGGFLFFKRKTYYSISSSSKLQTPSSYLLTPYSKLNCVHGEIRTPTPLKAPPPQDGMSTSFTTWTGTQVKTKKGLI